jgi:murein DD-endopeptidase MepM/ murein hydrolase activator NlpD
MPPLRLILRPFDGQFPITQVFANNLSSEPFGYLYADGSIGYHPRPDMASTQGNWHNGVDYGLPCGTPLLAPLSGTVQESGWDDSGFGNRVLINHGGGLLTLCGHMSVLSVGTGQQVSTRQRLGLSGSTGNSTGCHLHFSVMGPDGQGWYYYYSPALFIFFQQTHPVSPPFTATPMHSPLAFYQSPSFDKQLYISNATTTTRLQFDAWCHSATGVEDAAANQMDFRWYRRFNPAGNAGWTPSAYVQGDAPGTSPLP